MAEHECLFDPRLRKCRCGKTTREWKRGRGVFELPKCSFTALTPLQEGPFRTTGKKKEIPKGFDCESCGKFHEFTAYVYAHTGDVLVHTCDDCGAMHEIIYLRALFLPGSGEKKNMLTGIVVSVVLCFLSFAAGHICGWCSHKEQSHQELKEEKQTISELRNSLEKKLQIEEQYKKGLSEAIDSRKELESRHKKMKCEIDYMICELGNIVSDS